MATKPKNAEDAPMTPAAVTHALVEATAHFQNLRKDMELLRRYLDHGCEAKRMGYAVLSATLFASELVARLVKLQLVLADEEEE